jgi:hypothetical protein
MDPSVCKSYNHRALPAWPVTYSHRSDYPLLRLNSPILATKCSCLSHIVSSHAWWENKLSPRRLFNALKASYHSFSLCPWVLIWPWPHILLFLSCSSLRLIYGLAVSLNIYIINLQYLMNYLINGKIEFASTYSGRQGSLVVRALD